MPTRTLPIRLATFLGGLLLTATAHAQSGSPSPPEHAARHPKVEGPFASELDRELQTGESAQLNESLAPHIVVEPTAIRIYLRQGQMNARPVRILAEIPVRLDDPADRRRAFIVTAEILRELHVAVPASFTSTPPAPSTAPAPPAPPRNTRTGLGAGLVVGNNPATARLTTQAALNANIGLSPSTSFALSLRWPVHTTTLIETGVAELRSWTFALAAGPRWSRALGQRATLFMGAMAVGQMLLVEHRRGLQGDTNAYVALGGAGVLGVRLRIADGVYVDLHGEAGGLAAIGTRSASLPLGNGPLVAGSAGMAFDL